MAQCLLNTYFVEVLTVRVQTLSPSLCMQMYCMSPSCSASGRRGLQSREPVRCSRRPQHLAPAETAAGERAQFSVLKTVLSKTGLLGLLKSSLEQVSQVDGRDPLVVLGRKADTSLCECEGWRSQKWEVYSVKLGLAG